MYSTCLFCNARLGANQAIEHFPVGRRLAFDASRGRLWVVCKACGRWNLTPLEERWEAIEECERLYRDTRLRVATDQIGMAKLKEGLELVRIGQPERREFAAWRYGAVFGRRRRRALVHGAIAVGVGAGVAAVTLAGLIPLLVAGGTYQLLQWGGSDQLVHLPNPEGGFITMWRAQLQGATLVPNPELPERWSLELPHAGAVQHPASRGWRPFASKKSVGSVMLYGSDAVRAAGQVLARLNVEGAKTRTVEDAVNVLEGGGGPERYFQTLLGGEHALPGSLIGYHEPIRVALEMAANEESERAAMEGELASLEEAWRQAEEIAAISDDMFLPDAIGDRLESLRKLRDR